MGADVTALVMTDGEAAAALALGAAAAAPSQVAFGNLKGRFDLVLNCASASIPADKVSLAVCVSGSVGVIACRAGKQAGRGVAAAPTHRRPTTANLPAPTAARTSSKYPLAPTHKPTQILGLLRAGGAMVQLGIPGSGAKISLPLQDLVFGQKACAGSLVGSRANMQARGWRLGRRGRRWWWRREGGIGRLGALLCCRGARSVRCGAARAALALCRLTTVHSKHP